MKKTTFWTIRLSIALGLVGWIGGAIEEILLNGWDGFVSDIAHLFHWEHNIPVFILVTVGIIGGYVRGKKLEERLQLISTLEEKENFLTTVMEAIPEYIWIVDTKFRIQYMNRTGQRHTREELIGKPFYTLLPQEKQMRGKKRLEQAIKTDSSDKYETENFSSDGSLKIYENIAVPLKSGNKVVGLVITSRNITKERKSDEILKDSELKYQKLVENSIQGIAVIQNEKYQYVNLAFAKTVGYSIEEMLDFTSEDVWELIHPDDKKELEQRNEDLHNGLPVAPVHKFRYIRTDGSIKWVESRIVAIKYNDQPAVQMFEVDITERMQAELKLQESEEKYRSLFDRIPLGLYRTTPEGEILAVNPALLTMLSLVSLEGSEKTSVISTAEFPRERFIELMEKHGKIQGFEYQLRKVDGSLINIRENSKAFKDKDGAILYYEGSMEDITDRKQMEISLAQRSFDLEERMKEMGVLYHFSGLRNEPGTTIEEVIESLISILPSAYQYPEITCVRVTIANNQFFIQTFQETKWRQEAGIKHHEKQIGKIEIFYTEEKPVLDEGPFQKEERDLLDTIAREIGDFISSKQDEKELEVRNKIANIFLSYPGDEIYGEVLEVVLKATNSKYGIFGFIDSDGSWVCPSMTRDIWDKCQVPDKNIVLPHETWVGLWGTAMKEKRTIISNDKFIVPQGHIPMNCALDVPILYQSKLIGNIIVGNKDGDYDNQDLRLVETVSKFISPILNARMQKSKEEQERLIAERKLQLAHDTLAERVKNATKEIIRDKQQIEAIIETSPNAIIVLNESAVIILSNRVFKDLYERIYNQKVPFNLNILQKDGGVLFKELNDLFSSTNLDPRIIEPINGYYLQLLSSRIGETDKTRSGQIIEFFDVTPFVEFEKAQKRFITTISHELRTPITSIRLSVGNLKKYRSKMTEEQFDYLLNAVEENSILLGEIVDATTIISKIESGEFDLNIQFFSLSKTLGISLNLAKSKSKQKNIKIIFEIESDIEMFGDWLKIEKVFNVILDNAIKFSPQEGVIKVSVEKDYLGKYNVRGVKGFLIKISDKGTGIKKEDIQKIFEPFHKTEETRDIQGLGLGLPLAQQIAEIHKGKIFVESKFGKGSTFFLFLPCLSKYKELTK